MIPGCQHGLSDSVIDTAISLYRVDDASVSFLPEQIMSGRSEISFCGVLSTKFAFCPVSSMTYSISTLGGLLLELIGSWSDAVLLWFTAKSHFPDCPE